MIKFPYLLRLKTIKSICSFSILTTLILVGCSQPGKNTSETSGLEVQELSEPDSAETSDQVVIEETERPDDEISEFGKIINIEDSGYPLHIITFEFPERQMKRDFNFNVESGILNLEGLLALQDQFVTLYYTSELETNLYDIHNNGVTVIGEDAPESTEGLKEIIGKLSGAENATTSDSPGKITITAEDGETVSFEWFVTEELVKVNAQNVTAFYQLRGVETITGIKVSEE